MDHDEKTFERITVLRKQIRQQIANGGQPSEELMTELRKLMESSGYAEEIDVDD